MNASEPGLEQPLIAHLLELRSRLLKALLCVRLAFIPAAIWSKELYHLLAVPLLRLLPAHGTMIATEVASPFIIPFKLAGVVAFVFALGRKGERLAKILLVQLGDPAGGGLNTIIACD